jgi:glycine/D-amino acid oxidase-like deaminating enzyme
VVIVGAGYTGLWTAYYLAAADPTLELVVLEADVVGAGASGRNGGFCSAVLPVSLSSLARRHGEVAAIDLQRAAIDTLDEIEAVVGGEGIECSWRRGGSRWIATNPAQRARLVAAVDEYRRFGFDTDHITMEHGEAAGQVDAAGLTASAHSAHAATINPAQLAVGLARAVERRGVTIHEQSRVLDIDETGATTRLGAVRARTIVLATEGYTATLPGRRRRVLPIYSHMIATEPLDADLWAGIGWNDHATLSDAAREFFYAQRTIDDRIAIGGRGISYHWRSDVNPRYETSEHITDRLHATLAALWPQLGDVALAHRWGGVLGVPRAWEPTIFRQPSSGIWSAGGYTGDGVLLSNLVGRALAAGISGGDPIPGAACIMARPRRWEPEPLRWIGVQLINHLALYLDHRDRIGRPNRLVASLFDRIIER